MLPATRKCPHVSKILLHLLIYHVTYNLKLNNLCIGTLHLEYLASINNTTKIFINLSKTNNLIHKRSQQIRNRCIPLL